jgi:hypothetical protein
MTVVRTGIPDANGLSSGKGVVTIGADDAPASTPLQLLPRDKFVFTTVALTAAQLVELPAAASVPKGYSVLFADVDGGASSTNTISAKPGAAGDEINGGTGNALLINAAFGSKSVFSDGVSQWMER